MNEHKTIKSPDTLRVNRIPPGQHETDALPVLDLGKGRPIDLKDWSFELTGLVKTAIKLNFDEFSKLPRVKLFADIHCVTTWSKLSTTWEGVSAGTVAALAMPDPKAAFVLLHSFDGFTTNLPLSDFLAEDVIFALKYEDAPLPHPYGGPVRLIVPRLYFWKSAKWIAKVEFLEHDKKGYWEERGYHNHGDPWKEERHS
jgi:DMSO/TMAO reductase YedYZ molybdopterin-dependent catalytic subunit